MRRTFDGQRAEHDGVDEAEDSGVRADAKSEREDGDGGEGRRLGEHPEGIAKILKNRLHRRTPMNTPNDTTGENARRAYSFGG